jgi:hypothetical protein
MASDLSFFLRTRFPLENGSDDVSSASLCAGVVALGDPEASTIGAFAIGEMIIGGLVVCSLPRTWSIAENIVCEIGS